MDDDSLSEISCSLLDDVSPEISDGDTAESSSEDPNDMGKFYIYYIVEENITII